MEQPLRIEFKELGNEKLIRYAEFLLRHFWAKLGEVTARDLMKYMGLEKGDLKCILEALRYIPWTIIADWKVNEHSDNRAVISAERCPPQEARVKHGREVFACKAMEQGFYESFARVFNSGVKVKCHHAPPDPKPQDHWCRWEFILE